MQESCGEGLWERVVGVLNGGELKVVERDMRLLLAVGRGVYRVFMDVRERG